LQINTHYLRDLKRTYRATVRLRRRAIYRNRVLGALVLLAAVLAVAVGKSGYIIEMLVVVGIVLLTIDATQMWLALRRHRAAIEVDVDVEVTDRGISTKTATASTQVTWEMVQRVIDGGEFWIFVVNQLQTVVLYKSDLTPDQRTELTAFLASRAGNVASAVPDIRT
jgi:hypothetical protein